MVIYLKRTLRKLHERYIPDFEPKEEAYVYLSYNRILDDINAKNSMGGVVNHK